jgi:ABC-2 type transport system permease protein
MSDAAIVVRQFGYEQRSFWRNPASAFFAFALPVVFLVVFASIFRNTTVHVAGNAVSYNDYYIPALVAFGIMGACFTNIAVSVTVRRDSGILKRMRGTPLPAWAFVTGLIASSVVISLVLTVIPTAFGMLAFGVHAPHHLVALLVTLAIGAVVFCALGLGLTAVIPNAEAATPIVQLLLLPLVFISGTFFTIDPGSVPARIAIYFPVRHLISAMYAAFDPAQGSSTGFSGTDYWVMGVWGIAGLLVAVRRFRWEPRPS